MCEESDLFREGNDMDNNKNTLLRFLAGLALMSVGLFLLFNRVHVGSAGFGGWGRLSIFGLFSMPSGLVFVPFIIGIVWMFGSDSFVAKIFTALSVLFIIAAIVMNTTFWLDRMTMFDWLLILIMVFGGGAIVASILFHEPKAEEEKAKAKAEAEMYKTVANVESQRAKDLEKELNALKQDMNRNA